jgi:prepilin-type N-terminal cleavage/methylation domain-containing protein
LADHPSTLRSRIAGFTMVEIIVAIVIFGILVATVIPIGSQAVARGAVKSARAVGVTMYQRARAAAVESGRVATFAVTGNVGVITATPRMVTLAGSTVDTISTTTNFMTEYRATVAGTTTFTIDPRGFGSATGTMTFSRSGYSDSMVVSGLGRVSR